LPPDEKDLALRGALSRTLSAGVWLSGLLIAAGLAFSERCLLAGICLLIATPYLRVLQLSAAFARSRERRFLALSLTVFLLMSLGAFLGARG